MLREGPKAATGKKSRAPTTRMTPSKRTAKVTVSVRSVPSPKGADFLAPREAAMAMGATIGRYRPKSITRPAAISHAMAVGAGLVLLAKP